MAAFAIDPARIRAVAPGPVRPAPTPVVPETAAGPGNAAMVQLLVSQPVAGRPRHAVQRCGAIPADVCPCQDEGAGEATTGEAASAKTAQRQVADTAPAVRSDGIDPTAMTPWTIANLQRLAGNAAVTALLEGAHRPGAPDRGRASVQRAVTPAQATSIAAKLYEATEGWGTDEDAIYAALGGRTGADIRAIRDAFRDSYGKDLDAVLADELTDEELAHVRQLMPPVASEESLPRERREEAAVDRARVIASQLQEAMEGLGTDEESIFAALSGRTPDEIGEIKRQYLELTDRYLERDLQDELSGEDLRRAFNLLDVAGEFDRVGFSECDATIRPKLREFVPIARQKTQAAITALEPGWADMSDSVKTSFRTYFDPGNSGQIDERFVQLVLENFRTIAAYMAEGLDFDCELTSGSLCGDGVKWCGEGAGNGRLYWTCFGDIHVCANEGWMAASDERRWSDIIHESTHNALHTTDRVYCNRTGWTELTPYGTGFGSFMMNVPVAGFFAKLAGGGGDTLHNPDSYSHFAQER